MKKIFIVIAVAIIIIIGVVVMQSNSVPKSIQDEVKTQQGTSDSFLDPSGITVGIYEIPGKDAAYNALLMDLIKQKGFQVSLVDTVPDLDVVNQESLTIFHKSTTESALESLEHAVIRNVYYRKGKIDTIDQDLIIGVWNVDDFNWGELDTRAQALLNPDPHSLSIMVINAGAESGAAGIVAELLETNGYVDVEAINAEDDVISTQPVIIYHKRDLKEAAKAIHTLLTNNQFTEVSYRWRNNQDIDIVIELGPTTSEDDTVE